MTKSFADLCEELHLSPQFEHKSQLDTLENWCLQNMSQDLRVTGQHAERYSKYLALAKIYLDDFLANVPQNLAETLANFGHLNAIQYAAECGYNHFISKQSTLPGDLINEGDINGMTALHKSAVEGHVFSVRALLDKGADPTVSNKLKQAPARSALFVPILHDDGVIARKQSIFLTLLESHPDVLTEHDKDGNTALHQMASHGFVQIMEQVLNTNPTLASLKNNAGLYPVHTAILNQQSGALNLLLNIEGVASQGDSKNRVPLHYAVRYGTLDMVKACYLATKDINITDNADKTPLIWAAEAGNQVALESLIKNGAAVTVTDDKGYTILHHAIIAQNETMVRWIANNTADELLNQIDAEGYSPLFHAQQGMNKTIEEVLLARGAVDVQVLRY